MPDEAIKDAVKLVKLTVNSPLNTESCNRVKLFKLNKSLYLMNIIDWEVAS